MRRIAGAVVILLVGLLTRMDDLTTYMGEAARPLIVPPFHDSTPPRRAARTQHPIPPDFRRHPLIFLSTACPDSLAQLPGIGPVLAERIASARTGKSLFTRWEDLLEVKGIGPKRVAALRAAATTSP